jgi:hypothetical protein
VAVQQAREDIKRDTAKRDREEEEKEEKNRKDKAKREREEEEREEKNRKDKAKRDREEAKREREEEEKEELAKELAKIERARTLAQARARSRREQQIDKDEILKADATTHDSTGLLVPASTSKKKSKDTELPATKIYAAFISHKKAHSKYGDSSSTLSRSLKVRQLQCVFYGLLILFSLAGHVEMAEHKRVF